MWCSCLPKFKECAWTHASFILVDQWLYLGSPRGFHQTNYYKSSSLRKWFFVILTFRHGDYFLLCLLFHFPCLLSGDILVSVVFYSDFCLASFLHLKSLLPMISFSFNYIKFELYQNNTTYTLYHAARQVSMFFIACVAGGIVWVRD